MAVVSDEGSSRDVRGLFRITEERDEDVRVFRLAYRPSTGTAAYLLGVFSVVRRLARDRTPAEILHAHVHRMGWAATIAGTLLRRPVIISEHSSEWPRGLMTAGAVRRARIAFRRAALVCPVDQRLRETIESYGLTARYRIVPNPVDTEVFFAPADTALSPNRLVNVALHVEVKGLDSLLRAFRSLVAERPSLSLELIGEGPLTSDLRRLSGELGLSSHIRFEGNKAPREVADALRASGLFVLPSLSENLPVALLEALCCGLPVAATDVGGVRAAVGPDGELARPGDAESLKEAISASLNDHERFDRADIAHRAMARWSLEAVGRVWDEIYRSL
jgi:glycosyltransferase involved in cell wall biosynthesis